jgi:hypothetical protein
MKESTYFLNAALGGYCIKPCEMKYISLRARLIIFTVVVLAACNDDNADTKSPAFAYTISSKTSYLKGTVTVNVTADEIVNSIELFAGGSLITKTEPKSKSFQLELDTHLVEDGVHAIKLTAKDNSGNATTLESEVNVRNTLIKLTIPELAFDDTHDVWIFLSDSLGKPVGVQQAHTNNELIFPMPDDFEYETVSLSYFEYFRVEGENPFSSRYVNTRTCLKPGEYQFKKGSPPSSQSIGEVSVNVSGINYPYDLSVSGPSVRNSGITNFEDHISINTGLAQSPADLLLTIYNRGAGISKYQWMPATSIDSDIALQVADMATLAEKNISTDNADAYTILQIGLKGNELLKDGYLMRVYTAEQADAGMIKLTYPGNLFPQYATVMDVRKGSEEFMYYAKGAEPPSTMPLSNVALTNITINENNMHLSLSGSSDIVWLWAIGSSQDESGFQSDSWVITLPFSATVDFVKPQIPAILQDQYGANSLSDASVFYVRADDYTAFSNYEQYVQGYYQNAEPFDNFFGMTAKAFFLDESGGRKRKETFSSFMSPFHPALDDPFGLRRRNR